VICQAGFSGLDTTPIAKATASKHWRTQIN